ncbi:TIGR00266 family protein [Tenacibaculum sp. MAR_2010_89]|uniref:TIGR00266 family protein n=1 Tax=Tenacibaculum sp. MAR_2010_89 TaxID=1250198 RepID=UPI0008953A33|nr:TIGR00266 family protein [Tenacibaculum sp. MAR_2010_89]SEE29836.1 TIGR00266 family protein [Tenacibaculum sp. MAR_2010_89]
MKFEISEYPSSYLAIEFNENEKLITEKGSLIYCNGEYTFENKIEAKNYKNWIAKIFGGKSLTYNIYTAKENLKMALSTKDNSEIFKIDITEDNPILFEPDLHFARTINLEIKLEQKDWKSTLNDGLKLKTIGSGQLFLKGYGKIIKQEIDSEKPIFIDENALIAFEDKLEVKTISRGVKELITSGEGFIFSIKGKGNIWIQTREKGDYSSSGGVLDGIFSFIK